MEYNSPPDLVVALAGSFMDTLFVLGQESRLRILQQAAARVPGCAYLCAWAAIPAQPHHPAASSSSSTSAAAATSARLLCCLDAWLCDGGGDRSSLGDARRLRALFDAYRGSLCPPVAGCVPGWAYKDGRAYMELPAHDLSFSTSLPVQQQFYQMAAFMGCESGEIEIGMSTAASSGGSPRSLESTLQQVFSEDFFQQSLLEELLQLPPTRPSSPSSSLPSVSVGSPAADVSTSLQRTVAVAPAPSSVEPQAAPPVAPPPPRPPLPFVRHGGPGHVCFPSAEADDAVMAQAMLDVISASSSSALPTPPSTATAPPPPPPGNHHRARRWGAATEFRAYNAGLAPRAPWRPPGAPGQRMIKMGISILRRMHMLRFSRERTAGGTTTMAQRGQEGEDDPSSSAVPSSSQLNHMISERRRRERLNESFEALRGLLPPGSKKDKATVLAKTLDYMNILVAQIADLEAKNRSLESRAHHHHRHANGGSSSLEQRVVVLQGLMSGTPSSSERVQVHVTGAGGDVSGMSTSSSSSAGLPPPGREAVTVRVHARAAQGDVAELVARALAVIKDMGCFAVVAVNAGRPSDGGGDVAQATFTLRATAGEFDAASLREAVRKAAEDSATPPSDDS
ncbi:unnamed protein product [Miscanthus lutarioriparius]|uniref:BHLH domain-containing protein n=1 Tax=Miscanthus lutarioriparius TaxID=422564 RepID=A0A811Q614_9POAL|nr:unnamed protein product [Miscanthus lutarioriparius]